MSLPKICIECLRPMGGPGRWDLRRSQHHPSMCEDCDQPISGTEPDGLATNGHGAMPGPGDDGKPSPGDN